MHEHREFAERDVDGSVAARFERQVDAHANRLAIKAGKQVLTYGELDQAANRVAHAILEARDDREEAVVVLVEPGPAAVVMLLGALKAGKFYVPLDPAQPSARLRAIVSSVDPSIVLTTSTHRSMASAIATERSLVVDCKRLAAAPDGRPGIAVSGERLGSLFFTSGSTGRPKGVLQRQRNALHQFRGYTRSLGITPDDRLTFLHSHAFSASRLDIFGALLNGAALFPLSVTDSGLPALVRWLAEEKITVSHWVPTLFRYFGGTLEADSRFPSVRAIVLGSESVVPGDIALFRKHFSEHCVLFNRFGSTEAGNMCWSAIPRDTELSSGIVPVGFPVPDSEVFLVDEQGVAVEHGKIGEICVRSAYLSPGYWNDTELTRAAFLPDPEGGDRRIFLTGDLGRLRPDGALEHLGRKDSQVKVRGFRVEQQEVEAVLSTHPDVQEAVIDVLTNESGENRLVAYAVPVAGRTMRVDEVRGFLTAALPHYMIPSSIVVVDALPKTTTGKVDRQALSALRSSVSAPSPSRSAASSRLDPTEQTLVGIWAEVLGLFAVTATDNFFELGGNSLLAAQLSVRITRTFGRELSPAAVFRAPTIQQLAEVLRDHPAAGLSLPSLVPIQPDGSRLPFFWIHGDRSNAYLSEYLGPDQPLYGFLHQSLDGRPAAYTEVETLAEHYVRQIQTVQPVGPYLLGGYSFGGTVAFEVAQQLKDKGQAVSLLVMLDSFFPGANAAERVVDVRPTTLSVSSAAHRTASHFETLAKLGFDERVRYIRARLADRLNGLLDTALGMAFKREVCRVCSRFNWRLPVFARPFYIVDIYWKALRNYVPRPFAGRVLYVKTSTRPGTHLERWENLMTERVDVHEVPGDHEEVIRPANAGAWAERVKQCVAEVQRFD